MFLMLPVADSRKPSALAGPVLNAVVRSKGSMSRWFSWDACPKKTDYVLIKEAPLSFCVRGCYFFGESNLDYVLCFFCTLAVLLDLPPALYWNRYASLVLLWAVFFCPEPAS